MKESTSPPLDSAMDEPIIRHQLITLVHPTHVCVVPMVSQTSKEFSCHCYGSYCINFLTFQIEVSESDARTEKKIYRVPSAVKKVTTSLVKGNYATFARNALKHPQLKRAIVSVVAAEVRRECQKMCTATEGQTSVLKRTSASEIKRFH